MNRRPTVVLALVLFATTGSLLAHDLFLKANTYLLAPNSHVTIPIYNGTFFESSNSITSDRVAKLEADADVDHESKWATLTFEVR